MSSYQPRSTPTKGLVEGLSLPTDDDTERQEESRCMSRKRGHLVFLLIGGGGRVTDKEAQKIIDVSPKKSCNVYQKAPARSLSCIPFPLSPKV